MADAHGATDGPVTATDVELAVRLALRTLGEVRDRDWSTRAGSLRWDCWETVEHLADDLFYYATQLGPETPSPSAPIPWAWYERRAGGPMNLVFADRAAGPAGLLQVLEASAALMVAMARTTAPGKRAYHIYGVADPEGFAAMSVVEILVHMYDIAEGFGIPWAPPAELCARVLARLFPHVPADTAEPWPAMLWATGRLALPDRPRLDEWRWYSAPAAEREAVADPGLPG
ncbi:hypothetical protein GCM10018793_13270 [Streptomyces sulfonofaciens]|uniref:Mycothiol-dependent maleylpyruvate isomerase metal-binding domain-containing protein n=1 Tax=Streptomyces sulfonofaciens TaxID=68272 RepID=A0A919KVB3_9ACTN|nr:maleylpyruvate isomerase N-terminal domain-containing protein [Streptomyces sulfonofaciens]GHH73813.1 hypothetical protein GCM10018793_13270 [Streptomyces sulfonofaciens]